MGVLIGWTRNGVRFEDVAAKAVRSSEEEVSSSVRAAERGTMIAGTFVGTGTFDVRVEAGPITTQTEPGAEG